MKVYVFCPSTKPTGGVELLHQLVDYLQNNQKEAYLYYYNTPDAKVPEVYNRYNIITTTQVTDDENHAIILPETSFYLAKEYPKSKIICWWLSVDNYYHKEKKHIPLYEIFSFSTKYGFKQLWHRFVRIFKLTWKWTPDFSIKKSIELNYIHAYQSEYAKEHLKERGVTNLIPLKDYINTSFLSTEKEKEQQRNPNILYNPKKGIKFTRKLMKAAPDLHFVPLENLSRKQLQELFGSSMLYIDFGNHPGMDRLPREAALNGCCILTGKCGAAANSIDIPINESQYKFDESCTPIETITKRIREILSTYDESINDFKAYQQRILGEEQAFYQQIDSLMDRLTV